ncbi:hypothetical protein [Pseudidiomarina sediminum]|nr:hypothetical protein [Pseudidiomarina sediminum]
MLKPLSVAVAALSLSTSVFAQAPSEIPSITLTTEGPVTSMRPHVASQELSPAHDRVARIKVEIELRTDRELTPWQVDNYSQYDASVLSYKATFFDDAGDIVELGYPEVFQANIDDQVYADEQVFEDDYTGAWMNSEYVQNDQYYSSRLIINSPNEILHFVDGNLRIKEVLPEQPSYYASALLNGESNQFIWYYFSTDFLVYGAQLVDADGDGIADADDQCPATLEGDTVWFDGVNSGVTNHVDANGCAISDHYASCEAEAQSGGLMGYSGPSYCETQMGYQLYRAGLIDYTELRMLRNAL